VEVPGPVSGLKLLADIPPLEPGERFEVSLAARRWVHETARALARGFLLIFDYAFDPSPEYLRTHPAGTLMSYRSHRATALDVLSDPGDRDLTVHVNLAALRREAAHAGLTLAGIVDQTYFLLALGLLERVATGEDRRSVRERIAARTLMMPAGLGGTMKAMIFSKQIGCPALRGLRSGRLT
jgi:SAM-dependent MidA family methyltransferase